MHAPCKFHHHFMDTLTDKPCMHILRPTVHQSAFPETAAAFRRPQIPGFYLVISAGC